MAVIHINDESFEQAITKGLSLVDFWAPWCGPCMAFGPTFEAAAEKHPNINFYKFEVDQANRVTPAKYGIRSIPTIIAFKDGKQIETITGAMAPDGLAYWIISLSS